MRSGPRGPGRWLGALCLLALPLANVAAAELTVTPRDGQEPLLRLPLAEGERWCVLWNHSVEGFRVSDCYRWQDGEMRLTDSRQPDFAAGLGHIPGRGRLESDGDGYRIRDIAEPVPGNRYVLRVGQPRVNHRIRHRGDSHSLTELAAGQAVEVAVRRGDGGAPGDD